MSEAIEGGCRCGAARYRLDVPKLPNAYACHCTDCQTWSGSAFSLQCVVPEAALGATGALHLFELATGEGDERRVSMQRGCAVCMTRVYNTNTRRPGLAVVRAGTLDRSEELRIVAHIWAKRKLAGIEIPAGIPTWPEGAPPAEFMTAMMKG